MQNKWLFDEDLGCIVNSAVRYSLGRYTYVPSTVTQFIRKYLNYLDKRTIDVMIKDINQALEDESLPLKEIWLEIKSELEIEICLRKNNRRNK